jgi:hypothetical protein
MLRFAEYLHKFIFAGKTAHVCAHRSRYNSLYERQPTHCLAVLSWMEMNFKGQNWLSRTRIKPIFNTHAGRPLQCSIRVFLPNSSEMISTCMGRCKASSGSSSVSVFSLRPSDRSGQRVTRLTQAISIIEIQSTSVFKTTAQNRMTQLARSLLYLCCFTKVLEALSVVSSTRSIRFTSSPDSD